MNLFYIVIIPIVIYKLKLKNDSKSIGIMDN